MLYGFSEIKKQLISNFQDNKLHHCNLIYGKKGVGKATFVLDMSVVLLSGNNEGKFDNDDIQRTRKLVESGGHTDLTILDINTVDDSGKENTSKKGEINVRQVRKVIDEIKLTPSISNNKVLIVDSIDQINLNGQNALLKTLEEPTTNTYIFLVCHNINNVIETIKSRSNIIKVPDLSIEDWTHAVSDLCETQSIKLDANLSDLYDVSDHSVSLALDIIKNNSVELYCDMLKNIFQENKNVLEIQKLASLASTNEVFDIFTMLFEKVFENLLASYFDNNEGKNIINQKYPNIINDIRKKSPLNIIKYYEYGKNVLNDIKIYNLDKKHGITVLMNKINFY